MIKKFNTTGLCIPEKHYMVNIHNKLNEISKLIEADNYFTINKPRQYGKTTTLNELEKALEDRYLVISLSFEGIGDIVFENEKSFSNIFLKLMIKNLGFQCKAASERLKNLYTEVSNLDEVSDVITEFVLGEEKEVILFIDEVDKSSNNQLFLSFLGMLRNKYLLRERRKDYTFKSVILAGVHDVKSLKLKLRAEDEQKYNSPWNIAVEFTVDMSFSSTEIETMLTDYAKEYTLFIDTESLSQRIYFFSNGYPFLVSRICQIIDEKFYGKKRQSWSIDNIDRAVKLITEEVNTLFESLIKNIENNKDLYNLVKRILINGENIIFNALDPLISLGMTYGLFKNSNNGVAISNKIFEEILYNYMISKISTCTKDMTLYNFKNNFITAEDGLDVKNISKKFQQYIKENYSTTDEDFIEREGRLLFMAFIAPIINGIGFAFKEPQISEEKRLDLVITYNIFKYIIELKIWRGQSYHEKGISQLCDYLDINHLNKGYLVIFNFNKNKEYKEEILNIRNKEIFIVYV